MVDDYLILTIERLRDDLGNLKTNLRTSYPNKERQVTSPKVKEEAARLAEIWMVEIAQRDEVLQNIPSNYRADLNVHFQRILTFSEHSSKRSRYESELNSILKDFTPKFIIPLKQLRHAQPNAKPATATQARGTVAPRTLATQFNPTAFIGQSFSADDRIINDCVRNALEALGIEVITGERPRADTISSKIKKRIETQHLFVGIFTRRDKLAAKDEWTTSAWVIDEKAYAAGKEKKLILFKEEGVGSIGGIQGDYEYVEFSREQLEKIPLSLIEILEVEVKGFRSH
jgi:hypothetical protein